MQAVIFQEQVPKMINSFEGLPTVLSGEQVRSVLHISKRKCAWMLNNGFIKCENTGKKTRKYAVKLTDLIEFIVDSEKHPEKYVTPYAQFSTAKYPLAHSSISELYQVRSSVGSFASMPSAFRSLYSQRAWASVPSAAKSLPLSS